VEKVFGGKALPIAQRGRFRLDFEVIKVLDPRRPPAR
jgi:hypothetical protein